MTNLEIFTLVLSIYGSVLATFIMIRDIQKERRNLLVTCTYAFVYLSEKPSKFINLTVVNRGQRQVQIIGAGLSLSNKSQWIQLTNELGKIEYKHMLQDGERAEFMFSWNKIVESIKNNNESGVRFTKAFVRDSEGKYYYCKLPGNFEEAALNKRK